MRLGLITYAKIGPQTYNIIRVVVDCRGMYGMGFMQDRIARFICRNQPAALMFYCKLSWIREKKPIAHHIGVVGRSGLLLEHASTNRFLRELTLDCFPHRFP